MIDLSSRYLGLELRSPIVASPSPMTGSVEHLLELEDAGAAAVVLPSLFEEEVDRESITLSDSLDAGSESSGEATSYLPSIPLEHLGPMRHVRLLTAAKDALSIPVIASVNGVTDGGWLRYAATLVDAGADALELNLYSVEADAARTGQEVEDAYLRVVEHLRWRVDVPLAVKLSPYLSSIGNFARRLVDVGVDGLVLFNRFYQPDLDIETFDVVPHIALSTPADLRLPLQWIALLRPQLPETSLALTSGVHSGADVTRALLAGADVAMMASALLRGGASEITKAQAELASWMVANEYRWVAQLRGSVSAAGARDARAYERAQYIRTLRSYRPVAASARLGLD
jgi:dihydroorotate dehydrogenase (fumarate)